LPIPGVDSLHTETNNVGGKSSLIVSRKGKTCRRN